MWQRITGRGLPERPDDLPEAEADWSRTVEQLAQEGRLEDLWRLALWAAPVRAAPLLRLLEEKGFRPRSKQLRPQFGALVAAARTCPPRPPRGLVFERVATLRLSLDYGQMSSLAISPDGTLLAGGGTIGPVHLWHLPDGTPAGVLDGPGVWALEITPDGRFLLGAGSGLSTGAVRIWELPSGRPVADLPYPGVRCLAVTTDSRLVAAGSTDGTVRLWELPGTTHVRTLTGPDWGAHRLAVRPDGLLLAAAAGNGQIDPEAGYGCVQLWHLPSGEPAGTISLGGARIDPITFTADGLLAGVCADGQVRLWEAPSGTPVATLDGNLASAWEIATARSGQLLFAGGFDGSVRVWDVASRQQLAVRRHHERVRCVAAAPDGTYLVAGDLGRGLVWRELPTAEPAVYRDAGRMQAVAVSPDGETVISGHDGGTGAVWRPLLPRLAGTPRSGVKGDWKETLHERSALLDLRNRAEHAPEAERAWIDLVIALARAHEVLT